MFHVRHVALGVLTAAILALLAPAPAGAASVTTNTYSASSTSDDIAYSCQNVEISSALVVSANCNTSTGTNSTTLDISSHVTCMTTTFNSQTIHVVIWGTETWDGTISNPVIQLDSTGKIYDFAATCLPTGSTTSVRSVTAIDDTSIGLKNDSGDLAKR